MFSDVEEEPGEPPSFGRKETAYFNSKALVITNDVEVEMSITKITNKINYSIDTW